MVLNAAALFLILFSVVIITLGIVKIHEYPGKIAEARSHPQRDAIVACSLLGLLIFPFWMFALLWAYGGVIGTPLPAVAGPAQATPPAAKADEPKSAGKA
jgi:hypothetical protein